MNTHGFKVGDRVVEDHGHGDAGVIVGFVGGLVRVLWDNDKLAHNSCEVHELDDGWLIHEPTPQKPYDKHDAKCFGFPCDGECKPVVVPTDGPKGGHLSFMAPAVDSAGRKATPVYEGCVRYFPAAMQLVARLSKVGNDKHNHGEPMHHARAKSTDQGDCILRHQMDVGTLDPDSNLDHAVGVAWRALAQLQILAEEQYGWPKAPGAK